MTIPYSDVNSSGIDARTLVSIPADEMPSYFDDPGYLASIDSDAAHDAGEPVAIEQDIAQAAAIRAPAPQRPMADEFSISSRALKGAGKATVKPLTGAEPHEFFTVDRRIATEVLALGHAIGKPTELLAFFVTLCRGTTSVLGRPCTRWSRKAFRRRTGVGFDVATELHRVLIKHGYVGKSFKDEIGCTWYEMPTWAEIKASPESKAATWANLAMVAQSFVEGEANGGQAIDVETIGLRRILAHDMNGKRRADNSAALAVFLASHISRDFTVTGGVSSAALWRPLGEPILVAAQGNRRAFAFERAEGSYHQDELSGFAVNAAPLLAASRGTLDAAMETLVELSLMEPVIVAMSEGFPVFAMTNEEAENISEQTTERISGADYGPLKVDNALNALSDTLVIPFHIGATPELREAYVPAHIPLTAQRRRLAMRFAEQTPQPHKSLEAIDNEAVARGLDGGLRLVAGFIQEMTYGPLH